MQNAVTCSPVLTQRVARQPSGQRAGLRRSRARVQIAVATLSGNSLRQTGHSRRASVHQAAKRVAAFLRVAGVTAGLAESNGSLASNDLLSRLTTCLPTSVRQSAIILTAHRRSYGARPVLYLAFRARLEKYGDDVYCAGAL